MESDRAKKELLPRIPPSLYPHGCGINRHKKTLHASDGMKGCTQLTWPCQLYYRSPSIAGHAAFSGRSSGFRINLLSAPSRSLEMLNSGFADFVPDHSGGTAPDFNGIPY